MTCYNHLKWKLPHSNIFKAIVIISSLYKYYLNPTRQGRCIMFVQKMELRNKKVAVLAGAELNACKVRVCVLGSAVVIGFANYDVNNIADVCQRFGGYMNDANDFDVDQLRN